MQSTSVAVKRQITVGDPQTHNQESFLVYEIRGTDQKGEFRVKRRFSDFVLLRQYLRKEWPGCYVPSLPDKKIVGNKQHKFLEHRRRFLQYFCSKIQLINHLYLGEHMQVFLRHPEPTIDKALQDVKQISTVTLVNRYATLFGAYLNTTPMIDQNQVIKRFFIFVEKSTKILGQLQKQATQLAESKKAYEASLDTFNMILLPEYQSAFLKQHLSQSKDQRLFPATSDPNIAEAARTFQTYITRSSFDTIQDSIQLDLRQIQSIGSLIQDLYNRQVECQKLKQSRKKHQDELSKLLSGKKTLNSIFNFSSKQQQIKSLQTAVDFQARQIQATEALINYIRAIISNYQISKFKKAQANEYRQNIKLVARLQLRNYATYGGLMRSILIGLEPLDLHLKETKLIYKKQSVEFSPIQKSASQKSDDVASCHMSPVVQS